MCFKVMCFKVICFKVLKYKYLLPQWHYTIMLLWYKATMTMATTFCFSLDETRPRAGMLSATNESPLPFGEHVDSLLRAILVYTSIHST